MSGGKVYRAWPMLCLLAAVLTSCDAGKSDTSTSGDETTIGIDTVDASALQPENSISAATLNAQCTIMRLLSLDGGKRRYYVLNICPEDVTATHQAINISPPGEPSVTTYFDTIRSFATEEAARIFAEEQGLVDLYFEPES